MTNKQIVCPIYKCGTIYEEEVIGDKTPCTSCGWTLRDVERYETNDPEILMESFKKDAERKKRGHALLTCDCCFTDTLASDLCDTSWHNLTGWLTDEL